MRTLFTTPSGYQRRGGEPVIDVFCRWELQRFTVVVRPERFVPLIFGKIGVVVALMDEERTFTIGGKRSL
jgi:hypothetical protein